MDVFSAEKLQEKKQLQVVEMNPRVKLARALTSTGSPPVSPFFSLLNPMDEEDRYFFCIGSESPTTDLQTRGVYVRVFDASMQSRRQSLNLADTKNWILVTHRGPLYEWRGNSPRRISFTLRRGFCPDCN